MARPKRTFQANVGQPSVGSAGPDQIEYDLDNLFAMFDPNETLRDGTTQGGIVKDNVRSGIATLNNDGKVEQRLSYEGQTNGVATLDGSGRLPISQTPVVPHVRLRKSATQSIANTSATAVTFDVEMTDTDNLFDPAAPSKIMIRTPGTYLIGACIAWDANNTGHRQVEIKLNGSSTLASNQVQPVQAAGVWTVMTIETVRDFAANDYLEIIVYQNSGSALNIMSSAEISNFWAVRLGA